MTKIRLQNPYMDETIKVKEDRKRILDMLEWLEVGNIQCLQLQQIEPEERVITISPKNFAKEDLYDSFFEKPVVPQFVADWYEKHKNRLDYDLWEYLVDWGYQKDSDFKKWMARDGKAEPVITLVNMHRFGYEVEKEPRYTVKMKGISGYSKYLNRDTKAQKWLFASKTELERFRAHHTRKELEEAGFGWVFDCEGIETEEVDDGND